MESGKFTLVLGSQSPRRKQLLSWLNLPFQILTADLDEVSDETASSSIAMDIASQKAHAVLEKGSEIKHPFIISSDTMENQKIKMTPEKFYLNLQDTLMKLSLE